jgi:hypothetical protein
MSLFQSNAPYSLIGELKGISAVCRGCIRADDADIFGRFGEQPTTYKNK